MTRMTPIAWVLLASAGLVVLVLAAVPLLALPATLSLPRGQRPGVGKLTVRGAADSLRATKARGWELADRARKVVGKRMAYCRRNSFDSYAKAFERGYGYCQQSAYALAAILRDLGFHAEPVHCERCEFPDGPGGHAWVRVEYHGEVRDLDPMYQAEDGVGLVFRPLGSVRRYTPFFRALSGWGCTAVNAIRYYRTGSDSAEPGNADTQADAPVKPTRQGPPDYPS